jgi:Asp-tRNA(Asn)/Glu-tRNA(Gln) amidotransferase A subunit family amidase
VGLKPSFGRVSRHGVLPLAASFDTVGPIARTVEDAALLLELMAGADPDDPQCSSLPVDPYTALATTPSPRARIGRLAGPYFEAE